MQAEPTSTLLDPESMVLQIRLVGETKLAMLVDAAGDQAQL